MPVAAVIPAVFAGAQIATVGIAAMSAFQVIAAVGAIASGIGAITGNKSLMAIGGVASLAGGIGSFAQGQGWLSGDLAAGADANAMANAGANATPEISNTSQMIAEAAPGVVDPSAAGYTNQMDIASDAAGAGGGSAIQTAIAAPSGGGLINSEALSPLAAKDVGSFGNVASVTAGPTSTSSSIFDTLKDVGDFMGKNKELTSMGLKFLGGLFDDEADAKANQMDAVTGLYNAKTQSELLQQDLLKKQAENANSVPDMTGLRVKTGSVYNTGPAPIYQAPKPGLINSTGR